MKSLFEGFLFGLMYILIFIFFLFFTGLLISIAVMNNLLRSN